MIEIYLLLETMDGKDEYKVVKTNGQFQVFKITVSVRKKIDTKKIGETTTWEDAVSMAKLFTGKPVLKVIERMQ